MKRVFSKLVSITLAAAIAISCAPAADLGIMPQLAVTAQADTGITITQAQGWQEAAWVEWTGDTSGVSGYTVSYSGTAEGSVADELIRRYTDGHWRADLVGLKAGSYQITVKALDSSKAVKYQATESVTVIAHDRTGYTFSPQSKFESDAACGGYKADGTPKDGAEILYIKSASDIDTVTDSTGTVGLSNILQGRNKRTSIPLIIRIVGKINYSGSQLNGSGYIQIKPSSAYTNYQTTIEGIGPDTTLNFGFLLRNAGNVEIRNIAVHDFKDDGISLDTSNTDIWIHNCEFFYGVQGSGDKAKGDGSSDVKGNSQYVTLSYNHYWDAGKCSLCGMTSESSDNYITYHHNWFDHSDSRHPRIRTMFVHVYNNYYDGNAKYGIGASENSNAFVEGNYFRNCKYPTLQGSVGCDDDGSGGSATLDDSSPIGAIKFYNNKVEGANSKWQTDSDGNTSGSGDACLATTRNQSITYTTAAGAKYRNTDVSNAYIQSLTPDDPDTAKTNVMKYAGRIGGGDFAEATGFAFTSADDTDYAINTTLRSALTNYYKKNLSSQYVISSIGGAVDSDFSPIATQSTTTTTTEAPTETTTLKPGETTTKETTTESTTAAPVEYDKSVGYVWNYTKGTNTNDFLTVSANDWSSAGSYPITYGDETLTMAKKAGDSSASFTFTAPDAGKLILITHTDKSGKKINVNGTGYTVSSDGATTIEIAAKGQVKLTKGDTNVYLYYLQFIPNEVSIEVTSETATEAPSETTTEATDNGVKVSYNSGYTFSGLSGALTVNSSYGGAYYTVTGTRASSTSDTKVTLNGTSAVLTDTDTGATVSLILPTPLMSTGKVTISGKVTPSVLAGSWAPVQIMGSKNGVEVEAAAIRTDTNKIYNLRTNETQTLTTTGVESAAGTEIGYSFVLDFDNNTVSLSIDNGTAVTAALNVDSVSSVRFVTASGSRNLTVGDVAVATEDILLGDVDNSGTVDKQDATWVLQYVVGTRVFNDEQLSLADMNMDGKVTAADSYLIRAQAAKQ